MSCERYHDALTDLAAGGPALAGLGSHLESCEGCREELAALRRALALAETEMARVVGAEPSPGLVARICSSVAQSGSARAWHLGWMWPAMAASLVLLVALAAWTIRAPSPARVAAGGGTPVAPARTHPTGEASRTREAPERTASSPGALASEPAREGSATASVRHRRRPAPAVIAAPEVLVPQGEAEALVRFAAIVHRDRHAPAAFLAAGQPSPDLADPAPLDIEPLEIVPLDPAESSGTD